MTEEEMLRELDATSAEHQPPVEDYDPSHKQARKAAASAIPDYLSITHHTTCSPPYC